MQHTRRFIPPRRGHAFAIYGAALFGALLTFFVHPRDAHAVPSFARKYEVSCTTCHTVYPLLNAFGEAFRRNGFRFPSQDGSRDSDTVKAPMIALGQDEYKKVFPDAVWPDSIAQSVPLSVVANAGTAVNLPGSDAHAAAGNTFAWNDFVGEVAFFGAGAFDDWLTYFTEVTASADGVGIEHAFLQWNDIVGPRHAFNVALGRLTPQLTSWGMHSTYLADALLPAGSIGFLYNPTAPESGVALSFDHPDGIEVNGVVGHRVDYSLGWVASSAAEGLPTPTSQDAYAHVGVKIGGMSLDGEGGSGAQIADASHPWAETALTVDAFGYHARSRIDAGTGIGEPVQQDDAINVLGATARGQLSSFTLQAGLMLERHSQPYLGSAATPAAAPTREGTRDQNSATAVTQFDELDYVVYPWLVPALRTEWTHLTLDSANGDGSANLLRVQPGVAMLLRPNIKAVLAGEIERTLGSPPSGAWDGVGASIVGQAPGQHKLEAERITANVSWGF